MKKFKRFMVFVYDFYEARGGIYDCDESFDNIEDAIEYSITVCAGNEAQIFDRANGVEIKISEQPQKPTHTERNFLISQRLAASKIIAIK